MLIHGCAMMMPSTPDGSKLTDSDLVFTHSLLEKALEVREAESARSTQLTVCGIHKLVATVRIALLSLTDSCVRVGVA